MNEKHYIAPLVFALAAMINLLFFHQTNTVVFLVILSLLIYFITAVVVSINKQ